MRSVKGKLRWEQGRWLDAAVVAESLYLGYEHRQLVMGELWRSFAPHLYWGRHG